MLHFGLSLLAFINRIKHKEHPLAVLYFHRVVNEPSLFCPDDITSANFEVLLTKLNKYFKIFSLSQALALIEQGKLPPKALVLSFDDGYADNFDNALPVFEKLGIKASFFIATKGTEQGYLWNDELAESLKNTMATQFGLFDQSFVLNTEQEKANAYLYLVNKIKFLANQERDEVLNAIYKKIGRFEPARCMMTAQQLNKIAKLGHDVGAHTHSHSILAMQNPEVAKQEVIGSVEYLTDILGEAPSLFAYPNGWFGRDFKVEHQHVLNELGIQYGVATNDGGITSKTSLTALPRFMPHRKEFNQFCLSILKIAGE